MEIKGFYETIAEICLFGWLKVAGIVPYCIGALFIIAILAVIYFAVGKTKGAKQQAGENEKK